MKEEGVANDLLARMRGDSALAAHVDDTVLDPARYIGRSAAQIDEFLEEFLDPLLQRHANRRGRFAPRVRV
jgi:adenylosuccinate lyase